jgi:hypothetical protein
MAERAFCKAYLDLKAEAAKANELDALEKQIGKLKGEARRYEELGREADSQSAVLPRKSRSRCSPHEIMSVSGRVTLKESRTLHEGREPGAAPQQRNRNSPNGAERGRSLGKAGFKIG